MDRKKFVKALSFLFAIPLLSRASENNKKGIVNAICKTQKDQEGPYYKTNAPQRTVIETKGEAIIISGRVLRADDCSTPIANATIDLWHCDDHGNYDMTGFKCRGVIQSDAKGKYKFETIYPPSYGNRPRHIHVKVRAKNFSELTTQIYFKGDPFIKNDFARDADDSRVIELIEMDGLKIGTFPIYL